MAQEWEYMNTVHGWDKLDVAISVNGEKLKELEVNLGGLRTRAQGARQLFAQQAALTAANKASESGLRTVEVRVSGPGSGRESAVRALSTAGIDVRAIRDVTPIPQNGCRPPKKRRV